MTFFLYSFCFLFGIVSLGVLSSMTEFLVSHAGFHTVPRLRVTHLVSLVGEFARMFLYISSRLQLVMQWLLHLSTKLKSSLLPSPK